MKNNIMHLLRRGAALALVLCASLLQVSALAATVEAEKICGYDEEHTHTDACYSLTCGLEETAGHTHGSKCYTTVQTLSCMDEDEEHEHTDECYETEEVLTCTLSESEGHTHSDICYELTCGKEEHVPLADIPATGDLSALWHVLTFLSAAGLACLTLLRRKTRE